MSSYLFTHVRTHHRWRNLTASIYLKGNGMGVVEGLVSCIASTINEHPVHFAALLEFITTRIEQIGLDI